MLLNLREYHRPATAAPDRALAHALELLARPGIRTVPLAGGDTLLASADPTVEAVVDLQGLGLDAIHIEADASALCIGALATRTALADHAAAREPYGGIVAEAARRWAGSVQRNRATVGGAVVAADANDPLIVALLACDAEVTMASLAERSGTIRLPLAEFLAAPPMPTFSESWHRRPAILTEVRIPWPVSRHGGALAAVARTPADAPIVIAAATVHRDGDRCTTARLALGGVADAPLDLSQAAGALAGQAWTDATVAMLAARVAAGLQPAGDFRGSATYRQAMAEALCARALRAAWEGAA
jgi:carbon-monoxide dehydrogenase medium subunit